MLPVYLPAAPSVVKCPAAWEGALRCGSEVALFVEDVVGPGWVRVCAIVDPGDRAERGETSPPPIY